MASGAARATILVVEDHDDSRDVLGLIITALGYRVVLARNGFEALGLLEETRPALILCDVRMPGMDGFALVKAVRSKPGSAGVKLVALTGLSDPEAATRLFKAGFEAYLLKPLFYDALPDTLNRLLWMPPASSPSGAPEGS
jgi:CheY-like chemotaxis protein